MKPTGATSWVFNLIFVSASVYPHLVSSCSLNICCNTTKIWATHINCFMFLILLHWGSATAAIYIFFWFHVSRFMSSSETPKLAPPLGCHTLFHVSSFKFLTEAGKSITGTTKDWTQNQSSPNRQLTHWAMVVCCKPVSYTHLTLPTTPYV